MDSSAGADPRPSVPPNTTSALARESEPGSAARPDTGIRVETIDVPRFTSVLASGHLESQHSHKRVRLLYEKRIALFAILASLPGMAFGTSLIWTHVWTRDVKISLTVLEFFLWLVLTIA